jgi:hypothetical protein
MFPLKLIYNCTRFILSYQITIDSFIRYTSLFELVILIMCFFHLLTFILSTLIVLIARIAVL